MEDAPLTLLLDSVITRADRYPFVEVPYKR